MICSALGAPDKRARLCLCQVPSSFVVFITAHVVDPCLDPFFPAGERRRESNGLPKGLASGRVGPDHSAAFLYYKFNAITVSAEAPADLPWNRDLAFAADCAGVIHLYLCSLQ